LGGVRGEPTEAIPKRFSGGLKDKYGLSWQIYPPILGEMLQDEDPVKAKRAMEAMLKMRKIDIATLKRAYDGE
jgi:predicted 3-demethylubiquinone-9 3-methyltransferase (glyoxalase superfamily)